MSLHHETATPETWKKQEISRSFLSTNYRAIYRHIQAQASRALLISHIASHLALTGEREIAERLRQCGRQLSGRTLTQLKPNYYCRLPSVCPNCSSILTAKRTEQLKLACEVFSRQTNMRHLSMHKLLISPDVGAIAGYGYDYLPVVGALIHEFNNLLRSYHRHHNVTWYLSAKKKNSARPYVLGPTTATSHYVHTPTHPTVKYAAHQHVVIVTSYRASGKRLLHEMQSIWAQAVKNLDIFYQPSRPEVQMYRNYRKSSQEVFTERERNFSPDDWETASYVTKFFDYTSQPLKPDATSEDVFHAFQAKRLINGGRRSRRTMGMGGVALGQLPGGFNPDALEHRYFVDLPESEGASWVAWKRVLN